ncbi:MAG: thioredoxin family protein [Candidatus Aminicenantes bacterium]|nr:thioredoxin family protein [Candidatus Aminicenantes bacterium]
MECPYCHKIAPDTNYKCPHCRQVIKDGLDPLSRYEKQKQAEKNDHPPTTGSRPTGKPTAVKTYYFVLAAVIVGLALIGFYMLQQSQAPKTGKSSDSSSYSQQSQSGDDSYGSGTESGETGRNSGDSEEPEWYEPEEQPGDKPVSYGSKPSRSYEEPPRVAYEPGQEVEIEDLMQSGKINIFDFYSEFCPPCRRISPKLEQLDRRRDDVVVIKIDINRENTRGIDWKSPLARQYNLSSIPHFIIYDAEGRRTHEGNSAATQVMQMLNKEGIR